MKSGGNNFNDFPENQLPADFALLCKLTWWNATLSPFPLVLISFGRTASPKNIWGTAFPPFPSSTPLIVTTDPWWNIYFLYCDTRVLCNEAVILKAVKRDMTGPLIW